MGITYVGGMVGGRAGSTSTSVITYALTGGIEAAPRRGDLIIINVVVASQARNPACAITVPSTYGAWSQLAQLNASAVTYDTSSQVSYKFQQEYLDTTFTLPSTGNIADAQRYTVQVWRGVAASIFDATTTTATGTATGRPNPAAITPVTAGAYVLICGGGAAAAGAAYTAPANYTTNFLTGTTADTNDAMVGSGYRAWTSGAEDPAAYTGGTTGATDSWCCYTIALKPEVGGTIRGIEMGNPHNTNRLQMVTAFPDISVGVLMTGWIKQMTPPAYPYSFGNRYPFGVAGTDWDIICIGLNMATAATSSTDASINHNITLWGTGGDSLGIIVERTADAPLVDWVFIAWQFIMNGTDGFIMRQWLKIGPTAPYITREFTMTLAETRTRVGNGAFNFSAITALGIGGSATGDPEPCTMTRVRIYERNTKPTEAELTAIAFNNGYDTSAWADYPMTWRDGAADLTDRSGNGRAALTQVGNVVGGHARSTLPAAGAGKLIAVQSPMHVIQNGNGADVVITFATLPIAGNLITIEGGITAGTPTATDSESNSLTIRYSTPTGSAYRPFVGFLVMPAGATHPYSITITGMSAGATSRARAYEWQGNDATPEDWYKTSTTVAEPLTLTADSADTRNGTLVISSFQATTAWSDWPITPPADWFLAACSSTTEGTNNTGPGGYAQDISSGGQSAHRIFPTAATETITWPAQSTANNLTAVMVGFKPLNAPVLVQEWVGSVFAASAPPVTYSYANVPAAGNLLIAFGNVDNVSGATASISDDIGDGVGWTQATSFTMNDPALSYIWYKQVGTPSGGGKTVTLTKSVSVHSALFIVEYSGGSGSGTWGLDGTPAVVNSSAGANLATAAVVTTGIASIVVEAISCGGGTVTAAGTGYSLKINTANANSLKLAIADKIVTPGSYTGGWTHTSGNSGLGTVGFKRTDAGGGTAISAALGGSGSQSVSASLRLAASASLSGTGVVTATASKVTQLSAALTGTGALSADVASATQWSGSADLTGTGVLSANTSLRLNVAATLSGTGSLSAVTGTPAATISSDLIGAGNLVADILVLRVGAAALSGTGVLVAAGTLRAVINAALSGTGTQNASATLITPAVAALSGTGTLAATFNRVVQLTAALSGSGTETSTASLRLPASMSASGTGTLGAGVLQLERAAASLTGAGVLSANVTIAGAATEWPISAALSGSGVATANTLQVARVSASLSGTGSLVASTTLIARVSAPLTGSGVLTPVQAQVLMRSAAGLSGSGTLLADVKDYEFVVNENLTGSGTLGANLQLKSVATSQLAGAGSLTASASVIAAASATLSAEGNLIGNISTAVTYSLAATLSGGGVLSANANIRNQAGYVYTNSALTNGLVLNDFAEHQVVPSDMLAYNVTTQDTI